MVEEHVLAASGLDKPEAPVCLCLDRTLCHLIHFLKKFCGVTRGPGSSAATAFYQVSWLAPTARPSDGEHRGTNGTKRCLDRMKIRMPLLPQMASSLHLLAVPQAPWP